MYHKGAKVVDIYGGCMDLGNVQPVTPSTIAQVYSATKGAGALMVSAHACCAFASVLRACGSAREDDTVQLTAADYAILRSHGPSEPRIRVGLVPRVGHSHSRAVIR